MIKLLVGDCRVTLATLPERSVQACVTSPPYLGLRDYRTPPLVWGDGWLGSLGLEPTPEMYLDHLVECFRHVRRVLRDDGLLWVNMGDSYAGSGNGAHDYRERNNRSVSLHPDKYVGQSTASLQRIGRQEHTEGAGRVVGYKPKDLIGVPWMLAFALRADGWWLRSDVIWSKPNPMPESVTDRPTRSHEYVFLLSKGRRYFYDAAAVAEPAVSDHSSGNGYARPEQVSRAGLGQPEPWQMQATRNRRSVWTINTRGFSGAHFAVMPDALVEPMVKASTRVGDVVLDPFAGAGTVGLVADRLGRDAILCELSEKYVPMAHARIVGDSPLFTQVESA